MKAANDVRADRQQRAVAARGWRRTFFVCMYGPDVPLEVLAAEKTFTASIHVANVEPTFLWAILIHRGFGRDAPSAAFLRQIGYGSRQDDA